LNFTAHDQLLSGIHILEFAHRLPGPLTGFLLQRMGALVTKIEHPEFPDPFTQKEMMLGDDSFLTWYQQLNQDKNIVKMTDHSNPHWNKLLKSVDGVLIAWPEKMMANYGLDLSFSSDRPLALVRMSSSQKSKKPMHDLNALAESSLIHQHTQFFKQQEIIPPPFLPLAALAFSWQAALSMLACLMQSKVKKHLVQTQIFLDESLAPLQEIFGGEANHKNQFLHNGLYPCYSLYRLKDNSLVALAAVEVKYWLKFCEVFSCALKPEDRFSTDPLIFQLIFRTLNQYKREEIADKIKNSHFCLTII
jgi:crotonobetainyl-CoA:carnitine CoA-transferase CaiB-like acyl-CoA transferase